MMFYLNKYLKNNTKTILLVLLFLGAVLRLILLGTLPNGFFVDEASNGYDAYSLAHTLRDHYGQFMPLFLRAFDDYREALYIYLMIPFIKVFGLTEFASRLPSALIGIATIVIIYYLAQELFEQEQRVGLMAALFLALSPWHIHYSRVGFRAILFPCLFSLALLFFLKSLKKENYLILSGLLFGLSFWTYSSARVFVTFFLIGLGLLYWEHLWKHRRKTLLGVVLFAGIYIPLLTFWLSPEGMSRLNQVGLQNETLKVLTNFLSYFDPNFLFFQGDGNFRHNAPHIGQLYYFEFLPIVVGLIAILMQKGKTRLIFVIWLLLYPFPGAVTEPYHSIRSIIGTVLWALISGYGTIKIINFLEIKFNSSKVYPITLLLLTVSMIGIIGKTYFIDYRIQVTRDWQYGMREAITYANNHPINCAIMKRKPDWVFEDRSYGILVPFYTQFSPQEYQKLDTHPWNRTQENPDYTLGKFTLMSMTPEKQLPEQCLLIVYPDETPILEVPGYKVEPVHTVKNPKDEEQFKIFEVTQVN
ncbi:glycosyl transferase family 39 [Gloeothece citriformis PCC 7424]|uniref:Glycosyl transferase family 39 n=1 Tax=Gloeothece citriformis (strain PCC 7424) TaxID=65393 RepID=B7KDP3_GLOC7|nr:glycosyltransferase family 39 protein [Gloeothece citriformis]ACK70345.1 glycosyl transferase family 39 [Gloeothece citriformis PCC 7424]